MADADKTAGKDMDQEAVEELVGRIGHYLLFAAMGVITPEEGHISIAEVDQARLGDGHAVGVPGQVLQYLARSSKWRLGIDDPVLIAESRDKPVESDHAGNLHQRAMKLQLATLV
jgi:ABC-type uncharacterized transport system ATPase component